MTELKLFRVRASKAVTQPPNCSRIGVPFAVPSVLLRAANGGCFLVEVRLSQVRKRGKRLPLCSTGGALRPRRIQSNGRTAKVFENRRSVCVAWNGEWRISSGSKCVRHRFESKGSVCQCAPLKPFRLGALAPGLYARDIFVLSFRFLFCQLGALSES